MKTNSLLRYAALVLLTGGAFGVGPCLRADNILVPNGSFDNEEFGSNQNYFSYNNTPSRQVYVQDWHFNPGGIGAYNLIDYATDSTVTPIAGDGAQGIMLGTGTYQYSPSYLTTGNSELTSPPIPNDPGPFPYNNDGTLAGQNGIVATVGANSTYLLSVDIATYGNLIYSGDGQNADSGNNVILSLIEPNNGNAVFATETIPFSSLSSTMSTQTLYIATGDLPPDLGQGLQIQLGTTSGAFTDGAVFDNVRLDVVPEPSAWALMLAGAAGLVLLGRRKRVS